MDQTTAAFPLPPDDWRQCATPEEVLSRAPPAIPASFTAFGEPRPTAPVIDSRPPEVLVAALRAARVDALRAYAALLRGHDPEARAQDAGAAFKRAAEALNALRVIEALVLIRDELAAIVRP